MNMAISKSARVRNGAISVIQPVSSCDEPLDITGASRMPSASTMSCMLAAWPLPRSIASTRSIVCKSMKASKPSSAAVRISPSRSFSVCRAGPGSPSRISCAAAVPMRFHMRLKASGLRAMKSSGRATSTEVALMNGKRRPD
ncbi:hypothetical protein G6F31_020434 [Rhizopus arrhizus]|nr:hypothetical protein G6F31_020434 [Rhizopus arrhizus]